MTSTTRPRPGALLPVMLLLSAAACSTAPVAPAQEATPTAVLRTAESRFSALPGYPFAPHYVWVTGPAGQRLRVHYVDEGPRDAPTLLLLHGNPTWSYLWREMVPRLNAAGYRTVALDYVGMGRSDKLPHEGDYSYDRHLGWLREAFAAIDSQQSLGRVTIVGHDYGVPLGIRLMAEFLPARFDAFVAMNASLPVGDGIAPTHQRWREFVRQHPDVPVGHVISSQLSPALTAAEIAAWSAPYPDVSYKAAIRSFPEMVPDHPARPEAIANQAAWRWLETFDRPFLTIFGRDGALDPSGARAEFLRRVPGAAGRPHPLVDATHYAPDDRPDEVVQALLPFLSVVYPK